MSITLEHIKREEMNNLSEHINTCVWDPLFREFLGRSDKADACLMLEAFLISKSGKDGVSDSSISSYNREKAFNETHVYENPLVMIVLFRACAICSHVCPT